MAYFSNSNEGNVLDEQCTNCIFGNTNCPIMETQLIYNYDAIKNVTASTILNNIVNQNGCVFFQRFKTKLTIKKRKL